MSYNNVPSKEQLYIKSSDDTSVCYQETESVRYNRWFDTFLRHTNDKTKAGEIIQTFVKVAQTQQYFASTGKILDIGCGEGELATKVMQAFEMAGSDYQYYCVESNEGYVRQAKQALDAINVTNQVILHDAFSFDFASLSESFDFILVSHAAYYSSNLEVFLKSLVDVKAEDGFIMMIHGKHNSPIIALREKYSGHMSYDTVQDISDILTQHNWQHIGFDLTTSIFFSKDMLDEIFNPEIPSLLADCNDFGELKSLLEFIAHRSLTELNGEGLLGEFIADVGKILEANNGTVPIEAYMHLIAPAGFNTSEIEAILA